MRVNFKLIFILTGLILILSSCRTSAPRLDYQALARASILLGVDINMEDMDGLKAAMKIKVAHVGIYLKNGKFIHASTSKGVIVSRLSEDYYTRHWISGGRIR